MTVHVSQLGTHKAMLSVCRLVPKTVHVLIIPACSLVTVVAIPDDTIGYGSVLTNRALRYTS